MPELTPPPGVADDPALAAAWDEFTKKLSGTIGQARGMNNIALGLAGATAGAGALGALGSAAGASGDAAGSIPGLSAIGGFLKDHAGDIGGFLKDHAGDALAGFNVYDAAKRQGQADKYAQTAYDTANDAYAAKAPLRAAGIQGMLGAGMANPFARAAQGGGVGGTGALPVAAPGAVYDPRRTPALPGTPAASAPASPSSGFPISPDPRRRAPAVPLAGVA